jgi:hypothetical protein
LLQTTCQIHKSERPVLEMPSSRVPSLYVLYACAYVKMHCVLKGEGKGRSIFL